MGKRLDHEKLATRDKMREQGTQTADAPDNKRHGRRVKKFLKRIMTGKPPRRIG